MKTFKTTLFISLMFVCINAYSFDIMSLVRHPEIAERNSLFADIGIAPLSLTDLSEFKISLIPFELRVDYMLPLPLPFSFGLFLFTPNPNFKHFGLRMAYHFDIFDRLTDVYIAYSFDFGFLRNDVLLEYNDATVPLQYYNFRVGVRRFFKNRFGVAIETGYKFVDITFSFSMKIN